MNRREWLRGAALIAAGVLAAEQLELVERIGWRRKFWPGGVPGQARWVNIMDFGPMRSADGTIDITYAMPRAVAAVTRGGVVYVPAGRFTTRQTPDEWMATATHHDATNPVRIVGARHGRTILS